MEKQKLQFLIRLFYLAALIGVVYLVVVYGLPLVTPFVIGFFIAFLLRPVTKFIARTAQVRNKVASIWVMTLFYLALGALLWWGALHLFTYIARLIVQLPDYYRAYLDPFLDNANREGIRFVARFFPDSVDTIYQVMETLTNTIQSYLTTLSTSLMEWVTNFVKQVPMYLFTLILSIICSIFISADYSRIVSFCMAQLPQKGKKMLPPLKDFFFHTILHMLKAYSILLLVTFGELALGFFLLKVPHPIWWAVVISFLDFLPILGLGLVMIPWGIILVLLGNTSQGIGMLALYAIITLIRNYLEPKIVGQQVGLHPVVALTAMFAGFQLLGFWGMLLSPFVVLAIKYVNDTGMLHLYRSPSTAPQSRSTGLGKPPQS
mgnify:CR=1 FL=1